MIFVGNIPLNMKSQALFNLFKCYGKIEKIWFRSFMPENTFDSTKS
jgi:nucleolar protein 12